MNLIKSALLSAAFIVAPMASALPVFAQEADQAEVDWDQLTEEEKQELYAAYAEEFNASLTKQRGEVSILNNQVSLSIPEEFYYLNVADARKVLEEGWGNPPDENVLGMLFSSSTQPMDDHTWGVVIFYNDVGYVSDSDADAINYNELLKSLQADTRQSNAWRQENGFGTIELVGWAAPPEYRADTHKMFWAKELAFEGDDENTLNYDMRVLGRKGVLTLQFVSSISRLDDIRLVRDDILAIPEFTEGNRYTDFNPSLDKASGMTLAGLVAGGAGLAVAQKSGFLSVVLIALKKFGIFILLGLGAVWRLITGGSKKNDTPPSA